MKFIQSYDRRVNGEKTFRSLYMSERPRSSDDLTNGTKVRKVEASLEKKFIEVNPKWLWKLMVFDFDMPNAREHIYDLIGRGLMPEPTYVTVNPVSTHAQVGFFIDGFVRKDVVSRKDRIWTGKSLVEIPGFILDTPGTKWFSALRRKLTMSWGADINFTNGTMRNPLHPDQQTRWMRGQEYNMSYLKQFVSVSSVEVAKMISKNETEAVGRNHGVFNGAKAWAYDNARNFQTFEEFIRALAAIAMELNDENDDPMGRREVESIVESIQKWTWIRFGPTGYAAWRAKAHSSERQSENAKKRWGNSKDERNEKILSMVEQGLSNQDIADELGISLTAAKAAKSRAKNNK